MNFEFTEEQIMIQQSARDYAHLVKGKVYDTIVRDWLYAMIE